MEIEKVQVASLELGPDDILVVTVDCSTIATHQIQSALTQVSLNFRKELDKAGKSNRVFVVPQTVQLQVFKSPIGVA